MEGLVGDDYAINGTGSGDWALGVRTTDVYGVFLGGGTEGLSDFFDATVNGDLGGVVVFLHGFGVFYFQCV
jgi:hypothetical protein